MEQETKAALAAETMRLLPALVRILKSTMTDQCDMTNIPYGQLRVLYYLFQTDRSTVGEVASGVGVTLATASELIDRQVETGWIERGTNPADRRQVVLTLAPHARASFQKLHDLRTAQIEKALDKMAPEDRSAFVRGLAALVESLEAAQPLREFAATR